MVSSFHLAKKTKTARTQPRNKPIKTTRRLKEMEIRHLSSDDPEVEAAAEESLAASIPKSTTPAAASLSHGLVSIIGRKRTLSDATAAVPRLEIGGFGNSFDFFAVYGGAGAGVCQTTMHLTVAMEADRMRGEFCRGWEYWNRVMGSSFQKMEDEVRDDGGGGGGGKSGRWTAVVVMVGKEELVVAESDNIAGEDCRAVLFRGGVALPLSRGDQNRPAPEAERKQGKGISWKLNRDINGVIGAGDTSDRDRHHRVKPAVTVRERGESMGEFVVIGSKGLWDVVSDELAGDMVAKCFNGGMRMRFADETTENCASAAAAFLAELAVARGSKDNGFRARSPSAGKREGGGGEAGPSAGKWGRRRVSGFQCWSRVAASALGEGRETGRVRDSGPSSSAAGAASGEEEKRRGGCGATRGCSL
ncbi:unnamed protein product [Linum tenue]|uniref:PPM-type phosphatase domain-containing protein n=1 Tax=Linum tenue TaxID=586396 RepID=A0AAV0M5R0_9ROSI|nr:unnamed protein product [Linum tenue]